MDNHAIRHFIDAISVGVIVTTWFGWLPKIAALLSIIWLSIQIYDRFRYGPRRK